MSFTHEQVPIKIGEIKTKGLLINEADGCKSNNPWECHYFRLTVDFTNDDEDDYPFCEHLRWYLKGDIPLGISIDGVTGVISGTIKPLTKEQPTVNDFYPLEKMKLDGSNYMSTGRYKEATHTFSFTIYRDYCFNIVDTLTKDLLVTNDGMYENVNGTITLNADKTILLDNSDSVIEKDDDVLKVKVTLSSDVEIMVIKNNDIDNLVYCMEYLKAGHSLKVDGVEYTYETKEDFVKVHPADFETCYTKKEEEECHQ